MNITKAKDYLGYLPFAILFLLMLLINHYVYLYGDDFRYAAYHGLNPHFLGQSLSLKNVVAAQIFDYLYINGRFFTNVASVFMLNMPIQVWRLLNPILVTLLAYTIFYVIHVRKPNKEDALAAGTICALMLTINIIVFRQSINYVIGSFNYVYPMLFLLILVAYFRIIDMNQALSYKQGILFATAGFFAGWSQEQIYSGGQELL